MQRLNAHFSSLPYPIGLQAVAGRVLWTRVCPFILLSVGPSFRKFFWNLFIFFWNFAWHLGAHMEMCVTQPLFFGKIPFWQKWVKIVKNGPRKGFRDFVEWNYLWPSNIQWKPHMREKSGSQVTAKNVFGQSDLSIL